MTYELHDGFDLLRQDSLHDDDGLWVLVFPLLEGEGGTVDPKAMRTEPGQDAEQIFLREKHKPVTDCPLGRHFLSLYRGQVTEEYYQNKVRMHILQICKEAGFQVRSFTSIDNDETFLVISMDPDGLCFRRLAAQYAYPLPYTTEAYAGSLEGDLPPVNSRGASVFAYAPYSDDRKDLLQPPRRVDALRLMHTHLLSRMSLEALEFQGVLSAYFPIAQEEEQHKLHEVWVRTCRLRPGELGILRDYFGEEITLFFRWLEFFTDMLAPLGVLGLLFSLSMHLYPDDVKKRLVLRALFGCAMMLWVGVFNQLFTNRQARNQQLWGMVNYEPRFEDRANYNERLQATWRLLFRQIFVHVVQALFCLGFISVLVLLQATQKRALEEHNMDSVFVQYGSLMTVTWMQVTSQMWLRLAPKLTELQNKQTKREFEDALAWKLATIQVFIALWDFVFTTFFKAHLPFTCEDSFDNAVGRIWPGVEHFPESALEYVREHASYTNSQGQTCIAGCYPLTPDEAHIYSLSSCAHDVRANLRNYFVIHVLVEVFQLAVPIVRMKISWWWELRKELQEARVEQRAQHKSSILELQAKSFHSARYKIESKGGSRVLDFMQFVIMFALITCFGIMYPAIALFGVIANIIEYKLLAYRMVHVTCRPPPEGASNIGDFQQILRCISKIAVTVNAGVLVFGVPPMQYWTLQQRILAFLVLEHAMLLLQAVVEGLMPDRPADVIRVSDLNTSFVRTMDKLRFVRAGEPTPDGYEQAEGDVLLNSRVSRHSHHAEEMAPALSEGGMKRALVRATKAESAEADDRQVVLAVTS